MKTVTNAMYLTIDDEHIEAWLSDMKLDEMQEEIESTEKAIDNLKELVIEKFSNPCSMILYVSDI